MLTYKAVNVTTLIVKVHQEHAFLVVEDPRTATIKIHRLTVALTVIFILQQTNQTWTSKTFCRGPRVCSFVPKADCQHLNVEKRRQILIHHLYHTTTRALTMWDFLSWCFLWPLLRSLFASSLEHLWESRSVDEKRNGWSWKTRFKIGEVSLRLLFLYSSLRGRSRGPEYNNFYLPIFTRDNYNNGSLR